MNILFSVLEAFGLNKPFCSIRPFGAGLINHTWKVLHNEELFILQQINCSVFKEPNLIAENELNEVIRQQQQLFPSTPFEV